MKSLTTLLAFSFCCICSLLSAQTVGSQNEPTEVTVFKKANPEYKEQENPEAKTYKISSEKSQNTAHEKEAQPSNKTLITEQKLRKPE